jgi:hypothetical protein
LDTRLSAFRFPFFPFFLFRSSLRAKRSNPVRWRSNFGH